jgi:hypothetical protein
VETRGGRGLLESRLLLLGRGRQWVGEREGRFSWDGDLGFERRWRSRGEESGWGGDVDVGGGVTGDWESNREIPRG